MARSESSKTKSHDEERSHTTLRPLKEGNDALKIDEFSSFSTFKTADHNAPPSDQQDTDDVVDKKEGGNEKIIPLSKDSSASPPSSRSPSVATSSSTISPPLDHKQQTQQKNKPTSSSAASSSSSSATSSPSSRSPSVATDSSTISPPRDHKQQTQQKNKPISSSSSSAASSSSSWTPSVSGSTTISPPQDPKQEKQQKSKYISSSSPSSSSSSSSWTPSVSGSTTISPPRDPKQQTQHKSKSSSSSSPSSSSSSSSWTPSVSGSTTVSPPQDHQHQKQRRNKSSASSSPSSSSGSTSASSPHHKLLSATSQTKERFNIPNDNSYQDDEEEPETDSTKLKGLLNGSSSSSVDESIIVSSPNSIISKSNHNGKIDEKKITGRSLFPYRKLRAEQSGNDRNDRDDRLNYGFSGAASTDKLKYLSENQPEQSKPPPDNTETNEISSQMRAVIPIPESSVNESMGSHSRSSTEPKSTKSSNTPNLPSLTNSRQRSVTKSPQRSSSLSPRIEELEESRNSTQNLNTPITGTSVVRRRDERRETKVTPTKPNDEVQQSGRNTALESTSAETSTRDSQTAGTFEKRSSANSKNKAERKESTLRKKTEQLNTKSIAINDTTSDETRWKPPALNTFNRSNYDRSTIESQRKKDPDARDYTVGFKQRSVPSLGTFTPYDEEKVKSEIMKSKPQKSAKNRMPPPISEVTVRRPADDDSTLGTEGTYLERFPKKKIKNQEKPRSNTVLIHQNIDETFEMNTYKMVPRDIESWMPNPIQQANYKLEIPIISTEKDELNMQQSSPLQRRDFNNPENGDYPYITNILSSVARKSGNGVSERDDPPGDAYVLSYDPRNVRKERFLHEPSDSTQLNTFDDNSSKEHSLPEPDDKLENSLSGRYETQQYLASSVKPITSWVPPSMKGRGGDLDLDPTRIYINSLMTKKRSRIHINSLMTKKRSNPSVPSSIDDRQRASGEPYGIGVTDISELSAKSLDELRGIPRSEYAAPQPPNIYPDDYSGQSTNDFKEFEGIIRSKYPQNAPLPKLVELSYGTLDSKRSEALYDMERTTNTSIPQPRAPQNRQLQINEEEIEFRNSESSSASASSSSFSTEKLQKQSHLSCSYKRGKTVILLMWFSAVLIIASAIVVVVLWQLGILFNDNESQSGPNDVAMPTSPIPVMSLTSAPSPAPVVVDTPTSLVPQQSPSRSPLTANSPTLAQPKSDIDLFNIIVAAYPQGRAALQDPSTPQGKALEWLETSVNIGVSTEQRFLQRYVLATVYYSTDGDDWVNNSAWLSELDECNWWSTAETVCDELGRYNKLDLQENNLVGSLPPELVILSNSLETTNVRKNILSGGLPFSIISELVNLEVLDLSSNAFSGELSPQLFDAQKLTRLSLFENNISSSIPTELGKLTELNILDFGSNKLTSTIPSTIGKLSKLTGLSLFDNTLSGEIPPEISELRNLEMLYIDSNNFETPLPTGVCLLNLQEFWSNCEEVQCTCCTTCCSDNFGCFAV